MPNLKELGLSIEGKRVKYVGGVESNTLSASDRTREDVSGVVHLVRSASLRRADDPQRRFLLKTAAEKVVSVIEKAPTPLEKADVIVTLFEATKIPRPDKKK